MTFEEWEETIPRGKTINPAMAFAAGAASRDAEIAELKTVPMKYRRLAFNAKLQDENDQLRKDVKMLRDALLTLGDKDEPLGERVDKMVKALAATEPKE